MCFATSDTGYTVGGSFSQSLILKTINGGANWISQAFTINYILYDVYFLNSKTGFASGRNGTIIKTTEGGVVGIVPLSGSIPANFSLSQNYPNPFNPATNFEFRIAEFGFVNLTIYDVMGREVTTLVNGNLKPGTYKADWDASNYPSGVYFYKLTSGDFSETKRMVLIK